MLVQIEKLMSPNPVESRLSPFADCNRATLNVGYRDAMTGQVVASLEIPSDLIERAMLANISIEIGLTADGWIASAAYACAYSSATKTVPIDQLVDAFLARDNLRMEEANEKDLLALLERLQRSVRGVQRSIAVLRQTTD
jgi:hypothetical protein